MTLKSFFSFSQNKMFWLNIAGMILVPVILVFAVLKGLDHYTHHGQAVEVPNLKGMSVEEAQTLLSRQKLQGVVTDSIYSEDKTPGCIIEFHPTQGQRVKEGRIIYLTINTLSTPLEVIPDVADNSSFRQAELSLSSAGFKLESVEYIPGEKDWVYAVKYRGSDLNIGDRVPKGSPLTLVVGDGNTEGLPTDSLGNIIPDSIQVAGTEENSAADESWF